MVESTIVITLGEETFELAHVTVQEMAKVKTWTGLKNRQDWFAAVLDEDPEALLAAYLLVKHRKGEKVRWEEADFDLDSVTAKFVDPSGREIEPVFEKNEDGSIKTREDGSPLAVFGPDGSAEWTFKDTGDPVRPTEAA